MGDPPGRRRPRPVPARSAGRLAGGRPRHPAALALAQRTWKQLGSLAEPRTMVQTPVASAPHRAGAAQGLARLGRGGGGAAGPGQRLERTRRRRELAGRPRHRQGRGAHPAAGGWQRGRAGRTECHRCRLRQPRATVRLLEGSAIFRAARVRAETRPFVVESAGGSTRALGTRFLVSRNDDGSVQVGVLEHRVAVALAHPRTGTVGRRELGEGRACATARRAASRRRWAVASTT
uniref:Fec operon regulator FecR n=1 Tax=Pseudomonas aeruginosa TaxID=287 RepID=A0A5E5R837_PSEAI|nr:fec operon regulator FecR [Pseudomonas aeruginosa]